MGFLVVFCEKVRVLSCCGVVSESATPAEVNKHLELGRDFLARGQLSDALTHYHAAVGKCCSCYVPTYVSHDACPGVKVKNTERTVPSCCGQNCPQIYWKC